MWQRLERTVAPPATPVTVAELKAQSRIDFTDDDTIVERYINAATAFIEGPDGYGICLVEQTWTLSQDCFGAEIRIPLGPVRSISSITYTDSGGTAGNTLASSDYQWRKDRYGARIRPPYGGTFPVARTEYDSVVVTFVAGFAPDESQSPTDYAGNIPEDLRQAVMMLAAYWYEQRESTAERVPKEVPFAVSAILNKYRVGRFA